MATPNRASQTPANSGPITFLHGSSFFSEYPGHHSLVAFDFPSAESNAKVTGNVVPTPYK
jgi:hypothetical protein